MEELEKQNNEWLAIRKIVHRRARIELDNIYIYILCAPPKRIAQNAEPERRRGSKK